VNGHINEVIESTRQDVRYREPPLLLHNDGTGKLENMRDRGGLVFASDFVARALATGDFDNDGDTDVVFTTLDGPPVLLRNNVGQDNAWIGFKLQGTKSNRNAIGAKVSIIWGKRRLVRWITGGSSYLSSHDSRVLVGLGSKPVPSEVRVEIRWPNGNTQQLSGLKPNQYHSIIEVP
jgi:enediyne biosynthesis protein E4